MGYTKNPNFSWKDGVYILLIAVSASSSYFIDKTQAEFTNTSLERRVTTVEKELKETNLGVVLNRLDNVERQVEKANSKIDDVDETADQILFLLARGN